MKLASLVAVALLGAGAHSVALSGGGGPGWPSAHSLPWQGSDLSSWGKEWQSSGHTSWAKDLPSLPSLSSWGARESPQCTTEYDDVWEEKCETVYDEQCAVESRQKCWAKQDRQCTVKEEQKCRNVPVQKCKQVEVPKCRVLWDKECVHVPHCKQHFEKECWEDTEKACHVEHERQCHHVPNKVCKQIPIPHEPVWASPAPVAVPFKSKGALKGLLLSKKWKLKELKHQKLAAKLGSKFGGLHKRSADETFEAESLASRRRSLEELKDKVNEELEQLEFQEAKEKASPYSKRSFQSGENSALSFEKRSLESFKEEIEDELEKLEDLEDETFVLNRRDDSAEHSQRQPLNFFPKEQKISKRSFKGKGEWGAPEIHAPAPPPVSFHTECWDEPVEKCVSIPRDVCIDVPRQKCVDKPREVCTEIEKCKDVPRKDCTVDFKDVCVNVDTQECETVPREVCVNVPAKECKDIPYETCKSVPGKKCEKIVVKRPRKVCLPPPRVRTLEGRESESDHGSESSSVVRVNDARR